MGPKENAAVGYQATTASKNVNGHSEVKAFRTVKPSPDLTGALSDFTGESIIEHTEEAIEEKPYNQYKIDLSQDLAPPPVAMEIKSEGKNIALFTKGNFSIITGAAKARKTFLISMLLATAICKDWFQNIFFCPSDGININFDTEQSKYKVLQNTKRICEMLGVPAPPNLHVYSLRTLEPQQRINLIEQVIADTPNVNFVTIDGIIDLDNDPILQADQAQKIIQKLMLWSEKYQIHICCVLHYNKTVSTLLGHLGSFAHRKADAVISVAKDKNNEHVSVVEAVDTREKPFKPFAFTINENGLPEIIGVPEGSDKTVKKKLVPKDIPVATHQKHIKEIFESAPEGLQYNKLVTNIKLKYNEYGIEFGDSKARDFLTHCENLGLIKHNGKNGKAARFIYVPG